MKAWWKRTSSLPAMVRRSRDLPVAWRLWPLGWLIAFCGQQSMYAVPIASFVMMFAVWSGLQKEASTYPNLISENGRKRPSRRVLSFLAGLGIVCALMMTGLVALGTIGDEFWSLVSMVLAIVLISVWFGWNIVNQWWKPSAILTAAIALIAACSYVVTIQYGIETSAVATEQSGSQMLTIQNLLRMTLIFVLAGMVEIAYTEKFWRFNQAKKLAGRIFESVLFVGLLAVLIKPPFQIDTTSFIWQLLMFLSFVYVFAVMYRATIDLSKDFSWTRELMKTGWSQSKPIDPEWFVSIAFLPALIASPVATWGQWNVILLSGAGAAFLKSVYTRWDRKRSRVTDNKSSAEKANSSSKANRQSDAEDPLLDDSFAHLSSPVKDKVRDEKAVLS